MSMLAGIFYFDLRPVSGEDTDRMLAGFAGSDANGIHLHRSAGLLMGQAGGPNGRRQTGSAADVSAKQNICTVDGRVDNRRELSAELGDFEPGTSGDAALALQLYETGGQQGFHRLIGDWSLAIWDARSRAILLGSDYAGVRPLYYHQTAERLLWSSSLEHIARWVADPALDEDYAAEFLAYGRAAGLTPYRGIYPVPPGTMLRAAEGRLAATRFWDLPVTDNIEYGNEAEYEEQFRTLFQEAVAVRLDTDGPVCAELSGGLDSSSIVCMADRLISSGAVRATGLSTFTYCFPGSADEKFYRAVEQAHSVSPIHLETADHPPVSLAAAGNAMPASWAPRWAEVERRMAAIGSNVFLTGQPGDLIMGNWLDDAEQVADRFRQGQYSQAITQAFAWSRSLRVPVYSILWRAVRPDRAANSDLSAGVAEHHTYGDSLSPAARQRVRARQRQRSQAALLRDAIPSRRKHLGALNHLLECRTFQCPESLGSVHYSHPYLHRPLVEFMLTIPAGLACRPGEPRRLMRRSLRGIVPGMILNRRSKGSYDAMFLTAERPCAIELLRDPSAMRLVQLGYVKRESVTFRLQRLIQGLDCNEPQLRQLILLELWLRQRDTSRTALRHLDLSARPREHSNVL